MFKVNARWDGLRRIGGRFSLVSGSRRYGVWHHNLAWRQYGIDDVVACLSCLVVVRGLARNCDHFVVELVMEVLMSHSSCFPILITLLAACSLRISRPMSRSLVLA